MSKILLIEQPEGTLPTDETYSFVNEITKDGATWNVSLMRRAIHAGQLRAELVITPFTPSFILALKNVDLNDEHIASLTDTQIQEPAMTVLGLDGLGVCIDGNHRMMARHLRGFKEYHTVLIREPDDHPYRIGFFEYNPSTGAKTPVDPELLTRAGWGTFPQHSPEFQKRRT